MSQPAELQEQTQAEIRGPKCPHCGVRPCLIAMNIASMGMGAMIGIFVCQSCERILGVAPLPGVAVPEPEQHRIVRPS